MGEELPPCLTAPNRIEFWHAAQSNASSSTVELCRWQELTSGEGRGELSLIRGRVGTSNGDSQAPDLTRRSRANSKTQRFAASADRATRSAGAGDRDLRPPGVRSDDAGRPLGDTPRSFPPSVPAPGKAPRHPWPRPSRGTVPTVSPNGPARQRQKRQESADSRTDTNRVANSSVEWWRSTLDS